MKEFRQRQKDEKKIKVIIFEKENTKASMGTTEKIIHADIALVKEKAKDSYLVLKDKFNFDFNRRTIKDVEEWKKNKNYKVEVF